MKYTLATVYFGPTTSGHYNDDVVFYYEVVTKQGYTVCWYTSSETLKHCRILAQCKYM